MPAKPAEVVAGYQQLDPERVQALAADAQASVAYLFGSVENEVEVWDLFDHVVCFVADDDTLRHRLAIRTTNDFGKNPDELRAILGWNKTVRDEYRRFGATIIDASPCADRRCSIAKEEGANGWLEASHRQASSPVEHPDHPPRSDLTVHGWTDRRGW